MNNNSSKNQPPKLPLRFLKWYCHPDYLEDIEGDLTERFESRIKLKGIKQANWAFTKEVLQLFRPEIISPIGGTHKLNHYGMLKNYFSIAPRILLKNKLITFISLISLIIGAVSFQLIYSWVNNEVNINSFHKNFDNIYLVTMRQNPMAKLRPSTYLIDHTTFPSVKNSLLIHTYSPDDGKVTHKGNDYKGTTWVVDSTFFDFFDFPLKYGDPESVLKDPNDIIISSSLANKIFGDEDPIGETIETLIDNSSVYKVVGVMENFPSNSSMKFDILIPTHSEKFWGRMPHSLILVDEHFNKDQFDKQISSKSDSKKQFPEGVLSTIPLSSFYFGNQFESAIFYRYGNMNQVWIMSFIALMIIVICAMNFTNLQTIFQISTVKSLSIRHVNGASKFDLLIQSVVTKLVLFIVAAIASGLLLMAIFPYYEQIIEFQIDFNYLDSFLSIVAILLFLISIPIVFSIILIYKIKITEAFQNKIVNAKVPRIQHFLITAQYSLSIFLMISTIVVYKQFQYLLEKDLGYAPDNIIAVDFLDELDYKQFETREEGMQARNEQQSIFDYILHELGSHPDILAVSQGDLPVHGTAYPMTWKPKGKQYDFTTQKIITIGNNYDDLLGLEMVQGRFFNDSLDRNRPSKVVINEAAFKYWNLAKIDDAMLVNGSWGSFDVIGVVKDFNYEHLSSSIEPLMLVYMSDIEDKMLIKMRHGKEKECLSYIEDLHSEINPSSHFQYTSLESKLKEQYEKEKLISKVYFGFTTIALVISLIGLFAFAMKETSSKIKEVGIRKVHGASVGNMFYTLSKSFIKVIFIAIIIAFPIAWQLMQKWLENYSYRIQMSTSDFILTASLAMFLAFLAIGWQTLKVAKLNPIHTLKNE
ncbi:MAG: hypothetical protein CMO01_07340 [Thalassobius sp.]|nr:hypothetical protein [Thalassovita sp.]